VIKFQSYLAGSAFAMLLTAHIAMELLHAYPVNQYLWHVNIIFAREARPLLQHIDVLAGGSSALAILALGGLAVACILAARARMRLLAAVNCHIALIMLLHLAARSYVRTYPHGVLGHDTVFSLAAKLSFVQFGIVALILALSAACVLSHVVILGRCIALTRGQSLGPDRQSSKLRDGRAASPLRPRPSMLRSETAG